MFSAVFLKARELLFLLFGRFFFVFPSSTSRAIFFLLSADCQMTVNASLMMVHITTLFAIEYRTCEQMLDKFIKCILTPTKIRNDRSLAKIWCTIS
jgi:uncharacterized membrane protein